MTKPRHVLALLLVLAAALMPTVGLAGAPKTLSAAQAQAEVEQDRLALIDIRTAEEWRQTGVPARAHAITMHQAPADLLKALDAVVGGDRSRPIALICAVGQRSTRLTAWLFENGFTGVQNVSEGMLGGRSGPGWLRSGLPTRPWTGRSAPTAQ